MTDRPDSLEALARLLGPGGLLTDAAARLVYSRDASHLALGKPAAVALPADGATVRSVVRFCAEHGLAIVTRGTGTGLSGGAVPRDGEIVLGTSRLQGLDPVDAGARRVRVEAGVLNDRVSAHAASCGLHFAPDPSSQSAASIGGNIAENAGGPHCLRHGVTLQHLLRLEWCDERGRELATGRGLAGERGIDLVSLLCGSEGTLGVVTAADLKLMPNPPATITLLAFFGDLDQAAGSVVALLGAGLLPVAVEMIDRPMLEAVEAAFGFGFPIDPAAAMILEFAGGQEETAEDAAGARELLTGAGAGEIRLAEDEATRLELWKCRKKAFGAVGRLAPSYVTMDVVVPLGRLPELVREIQVIKARHGVEIATAFHAGDGNLHPGVHYDDRDDEQRRAAHAAADEIMRTALAMGGSVTGEHGVGIEKLHAIPWQLDAVTAGLMSDIKRVFDPGDRLNPGKALPAPDVSFAAPKPVPGGLSFDWNSLTVTAAADVSLAELQAVALDKGVWLPVGLAGPADGSAAAGPGLGCDRSVGSLVEDLLFGPSLLAVGSVRDFLLELWAETGDGRVIHAGAPVFKNVVGYNLGPMICGSGRVLAVPLAATFQLRPAAERLGVWRFEALPGVAGGASGARPLLRVLSRRDAVRGGPLCVIDAAGERTVTILAPGRDRTWDLGDLDERLINAAGQSGLARTGHEIFEFSSWRRALESAALPAWAMGSADWTALTRIPGGEQELEPCIPEIGPRMIWQAAPHVVWVPEAAASGPGWHPDTCCRNGLATALPEPGPGVPRDLLYGLKRLFDPDGNLDSPPWLKEDGDE